MKPTQVKHIAKQMVANQGPYNVLEFGSELFEEQGYKFVGDVRAGDLREATEEEALAILTEADRQARRVLDFLGDLG